MGFGSGIRFEVWTPKGKDGSGVWVMFAQVSGSCHRDSGVACACVQICIYIYTRYIYVYIYMCTCTYSHICISLLAYRGTCFVHYLPEFKNYGV